MYISEIILTRRKTLLQALRQIDKHNLLERDIPNSGLDRKW